MQRTLIFLLIMLWSSVLFGQQLTLENTKNRNTINLSKGTRVGYFLHDGRSIKTGFVSNFSDSSVTINDNEHLFSDFKSIGPRKKGTLVKVLGLAFATGIVSGISLSTLETSNSKALPILGLTSGLSLFALCEAVAIRNQPKKLKKKWNLVYSN